MKDIQYYVGIGASAGGLEALESFFKVMPEDSGLSFFVIQHLSPDYKSLMNELLARHTTMKIKIAETGMKAEANTIYLIPPRNNMSIFHGELFLEEQVSHQHRISLPIDIFFRSLAKDQEKKAIGIILSGTGSDGTLGVRAIKEAGGMVMVQDEDSAKFNGMPKSSISTGLVDYILPPNRMPEELMNFIKHPSIQDVLKHKEDIKDDMDDITKICMLLRNYGGIDFSNYKNNTMIRRIDRRIKINRMDSLDKYVQLLKESDHEKETLQRELLIGVTAFFRDREAFESLQEKVFSNFDYSKKQIRIWSAACSTGEEVYSVAIQLLEYLEKNNITCDVKIFATDIDNKALETASIGYYPESLVADIDPLLVHKYFDVKNDRYQVKESLRKLIVFATHNILKDPPFSKLDLLICRNFFIYLKPHIQQEVLKTFYYSLQSNGYLFLGSSESVGDMSEAFSVVDSKWKLFQHKEGFKPPISKSIIMHHDTSNIMKPMQSDIYTSNNLRFEKLLVSILESKIPPSIIIDSSDNIVQAIGETGNFIRMQSGRFSNNFNSNMSKELSLFVNNIIRRLKLEQKEIIFNNVSTPSQTNQLITLVGSSITLNNISFYLISFIETPEVETTDNFIEVDMTKEVKERVKQLEMELQIAREGLQATIEELETSNEELQSSNEELIASNEELQSTNEELQSVNEELYTVNNEHQSKIEQLTNLNNDLNNLLKNTEVGALYLDNNLCIRKFTPLITKITNVRENDLGRPISHIAVMPEYQDIIDDIYKVTDSLQGIEREILASDGTHYFAKIRPYRSQFNSVSGVILTIVDISSLKTQQVKTDQANQRLNLAMEISNSAWWEYNLETGHVIYSDKKATMIGYTVEEFPNDVYEICDLIHPEDYEETMQAMRDYIEGRTEEWNVTYRIKRKDGSYATYHDVGQIAEYSPQGMPRKLIGTVIDISRIKTLEHKVKSLEDQ